MKKILLLIAVLGSVNIASAQLMTEVKLLKGEKWWGVFVSDSPAQPFVSPLRVDEAPGRAPMLVSSEGRYIAGSKPFSFELDGENLTVTSLHELLTVEKAGKTLREAYLVCCHKNFPPAGTFPDPALFTMPVYETYISMGHDQSQDKILAYATRLLADGFPAGTMVICDGWQSASGAYDFNRELYPDPAAMLEKLHSMGFKAMLTVTPYVPAAGANYVRALRGGELLVKERGEPFIFQGADGSFNAVCDLTGRDCEISVWFEEIQKKYGFDGYRFDCGTADEILPAATRDAIMTVWMNMGEGIAFRDHIGGDKEPFTPFTTDIRSSKKITDAGAFTDIINNVLSAGLVGYPYAHDALSVDDARALTANGDLAARYMILQAAMPVAKVDLDPRGITDPKVFEALKTALNFRLSLAGYLDGLVKESARTAEPIIRHLEYCFPHNGFSDCTDQFMLGGKYLIALCADGAAKRMVRLPKGTWTDKYGKRFKGPLLTEASCTDGLIYFELTGK